MHHISNESLHYPFVYEYLHVYLFISFISETTSSKCISTHVSTSIFESGDKGISHYLGSHAKNKNIILHLAYSSPNTYFSSSILWEN